MQIFTAKYLAIFFGLAAIALTISTIVLAVQKSEVQDQLNGALDKLNSQESSTTTTTTTLAPVSPPIGPTSSTKPTPEAPTDFPWPTLTDTTSTSTTQNPNFPNPNEIVYRLPNHVRPWQYKLYLHPDLKNGTFEGTVSIGLSIDKLTNVIALC